MSIVRPELDAYMSAECFRYLRQYAEETAGRGLIVMAGKYRGLSLEDYLKGIDPHDTTKITETLNRILGKDGTRLCIVDEVKQISTGYEIRVSESACSTGVKSSEPHCAFTMGVFVGAMTAITKKQFAASELECVAMDKPQCVYKLDQI